VAGTANLIEATKLAGVRRFVGENIASQPAYRTVLDGLRAQASARG
jgi:hypothetical protein